MRTPTYDPGIGFGLLRWDDTVHTTQEYYPQSARTAQTVEIPAFIPVNDEVKLFAEASFIDGRLDTITLSPSLIRRKPDQWQATRQEVLHTFEAIAESSLHAIEIEEDYGDFKVTIRRSPNRQ